MRCGGLNLSNFHLLALCTWFFCLFFSTQMLYPLFATYLPRWRCSTTPDMKFARDCQVYLQCLGNNSKLDFDEDYYYSSAREFDWICGPKAPYRFYFTLLSFVGVFTGALVFGAASDHFGRRRVTILILTMGTAALALSAFAPNWWLFYAARFVVGMSSGGIWVSTYTYIMESLEPQQRLPMNELFNWGFARLIFSLLNALFTDWRRASIAHAVIALPGLASFVFLLPESQTWLSKNKNGRGGVGDVVDERRDRTVSIVVVVELRMIFTNPTFLRRMGVLNMMFLVGTTSGYLTDLNSPSLRGNLFFNQSLFSVLLIGSKLLLLAVVSLRPRFHRRTFHQGAQTVVCLCYLALTLITVFWDNQTTAILVINVIGTAFIEYTWDTTYICSMELMPTEVRATAVGIGSTVGRLGMVLSPILLEFNQLWEASAYAIVFTLGALNLLVSWLWLDETCGVNLAEVKFSATGGAKKQGTAIVAPAAPAAPISEGSEEQVES